MRLFWRLTGYGFFALGAAGTMLPLVPTTGPWLLSVFCLLKGGDPLAQKLLDHPRFGPHLRAWFDAGAISRSGKIAAVTAIATGLILIFVLGANDLALILLTGCAICLSAWLWTRPEPMVER